MTYHRDEDDDELKAAIDARIDSLLSNPNFGMHTRESLYEVARDLVRFEKFADGKLEDDNLDLALVTMTKLKRFLFEGKRHIATAFHPEQELIDLKNTNPEQFLLAVEFLAFFTTLKLSKSAIDAYHAPQQCRCTPGEVRLIWNTSSGQFIYHR